MVLAATLLLVSVAISRHTGGSKGDAEGDGTFDAPVP
jgi:hypothetical protein